MTTHRWSWLLVLASVAFGGTIDPSVKDSAHVEYGRQFPFVASLSCRSTTSGVTQRASCVLIDDHWIVTAAHVVEGTDEWTVTTDDGHEHPLSSVIIHPDYDHAKPRTADLAIGRAPDGFGLDFYPPLLAGEGGDEAGQVVSLAGFGMTGSFSTGAVRHDGLRRAGSNVIDSVSDGVVTCSVGGRRKTSLEFLITPGDSGGGLFIGDSLAGIHSFISRDGRVAPRGVYGDESSHTRVSIHRDWILTEMQCNGDE